MTVADRGLPVAVPSTALFTDQYELTMLQAALRGGTAERRCVFEVFARRLPEGRRYGVVAGTGRVLDAVENFRFDDQVLDFLRRARHRRRADPAVARRLPLQRRHPRLPGGRGLLPRLAGDARRGQLRGVRAAGDRDPLDPQPRLRRRRRRLPDGGRRGRAPAGGDGRAAHARAVGRRRLPRRLPRRLRLHLRPRGRVPLRHPDRRHQRALLHAAARQRARRLHRAGRLARQRHDAARGHLRRRRGRARAPSRSPGPAWAPYGSTPATCCCSPTGSATSWTNSAPRGRRSWSPAIWTSTPSPRWRRRPSTPTASARSSSPAAATRPAR